MTPEQIRFNNYCASVMGWMRGTGKNAHLYFHDTGELFGICKGPVDRYNPYNDLVLMSPVLDNLMLKHNELRMNSERIFQVGLHVATRELITESMIQADELIAENDSEDPNDSKFGETCDKLKDLSDTILAAKDDLQPPPITNFAYGLDYDTKAGVGNCTNFGYDEYESETGGWLKPKPTPFPNTIAEQKKFNAQCRSLVHMKVTDDNMLPDDYDPYRDMNELSLVMEIVLKHCGVAFTINSGLSTSILKEMRRYVEYYGADKYMLNAEELFNKNCETLVRGYNIVGCQPTNDGFDPYNYINDLAPILPIVTSRVQEEFTLGKVMYDLPQEESYNLDVHDNMRHYIQRHMITLLDILAKYDDPEPEGEVVAAIMEEAIEIKENMGYPLLIRSMSIKNDYVFVTNDEYFTEVCAQKFTESPLGCIGITDDVPEGEM